MDSQGKQIGRHDVTDLDCLGDRQRHASVLVGVHPLARRVSSYAVIRDVAIW